MSSFLSRPDNGTRDATCCVLGNHSSPVLVCLVVAPLSARKAFSQAVQLGTFKELHAARAGGSMQKVRQKDTA